MDELLQETYARLLAATQAEGARVRSVRALALTIARNTALDWLRRRDVVPMDLISDLAALDVLDESAQIEEIVNAHQELALLAECVAELPRSTARPTAGSSSTIPRSPASRSGASSARSRSVASSPLSAVRSESRLE